MLYSQKLRSWPRYAIEQVVFEKFLTRPIDRSTRPSYWKTSYSWETNSKCKGITSNSLLFVDRSPPQASDLKSTTRLAEKLLTLTHEARNYKLLTSNLILLSKKHGQLKAVVQAMVELVMTWLDEIREKEGRETWLSAIHALRDVTEGKVRISSFHILRDFSQYSPVTRFSSKPLVHASPSFWHTTTSPSQMHLHKHQHYDLNLCKLPQTCYLNYRSKHTRRWSGERRPSFCLSRWDCWWM